MPRAKNPISMRFPNFHYLCFFGQETYVFPDCWRLPLVMEKNISKERLGRSSSYTSDPRVDILYILGASGDPGIPGTPSERSRPRGDHVAETAPNAGACLGSCSGAFFAGQVTQRIQIPTLTNQNPLFCRVPINSIYSVILGTYKNVGSGWLG